MSDYQIFITPRAWRELKALPGNMRQRLRRDIDGLALDPRPPQSRPLALSGDAESAAEEQLYELRRLRVERWRVVYAVTEGDKIVDVLTVQRRPPYDYGNLSELIADLS